jgi:hypothetical protein
MDPTNLNLKKPNLTLTLTLKHESIYLNPKNQLENLNLKT